MPSSMFFYPEERNQITQDEARAGDAKGRWDHGRRPPLADAHGDRAAHVHRLRSADSRTHDLACEIAGADWRG